MHWFCEGHTGFPLRTRRSWQVMFLARGERTRETAPSQSGATAGHLSGNDQPAPTRMKHLRDMAIEIMIRVSVAFQVRCCRYGSFLTPTRRCTVRTVDHGHYITENAPLTTTWYSFKRFMDCKYPRLPRPGVKTFSPHPRQQNRTDSTYEKASLTLFSRR